MEPLNSLPWRICGGPSMTSSSGKGVRGGLWWVLWFVCWRRRVASLRWWRGLCALYKAKGCDGAFLGGIALQGWGRPFQRSSFTLGLNFANKIQPAIQNSQKILRAYHTMLFSESRKLRMHISVTSRCFLELLRWKLHSTYSFARSENYNEQLFWTCFLGYSHVSYIKNAFGIVLKIVSSWSGGQKRLLQKFVRGSGALGTPLVSLLSSVSRCVTWGFIWPSSKVDACFSHGTCITIAHCKSGDNGPKNQRQSWDLRSPFPQIHYSACGALCQGRVWREKGTQTQTFWSGYLRVGWGSSTRRGGGQNVRHVFRNPGKANFLAGYPGLWPGYPGGARKVWGQKVCVQFLSPKEVRNEIGPNFCNSKAKTLRRIQKMPGRKMLSTVQLSSLFFTGTLSNLRGRFQAQIKNLIHRCEIAGTATLRRGDLPNCQARSSQCGSWPRTP